MAEKLKAAVVGSTGYGGVELVRLLLNHPHVELASVVSSSQAGQAYADSYPHLNGIVTERMDELDAAALARKADVVFTATPHGVSAELAPGLLGAGLKVIDISGDFRLKDPESYTQWYKRPAADPAYLAQAVYGLPELFGEDLPGASFISNPGCYPTATVLGLAPLLAAGWIDEKSVIVDAKSGVSGAGRGLGQVYHYSEMNENFLAYKLHRHQHIPEIEQTLTRVSGSPITVTFTTHLVPMTRGILCTEYAALNDSKTDADLVRLYREFYEGRPFVRIREPGKLPATKEVWGSNYCDIAFAVDVRTGRVTVVSVIDNLVKGAAGQAIQYLNLAMGWDETAGLRYAPVYP